MRQQKITAVNTVATLNTGTKMSVVNTGNDKADRCEQNGRYEHKIWRS